MKDGTQVTNYGKLALNDSQDTTKYCGEYSAGYGDGLALMYFNNVGRYGNEITDDGITSKTFDLSEETASADCISAALGGNVAKFEIVSIVLTKKPAEDVTDATLTGYSALTSGAGGFKFADGTGYPENFDITNYKSVTVNFKIYDSDGNVMKDGTQVTNYGKLALNDSQNTTKYCGDYSAGYGDGFALMYFNNVGRYGNAITEDGITSKTFNLSEDTATADCISAALGGNVAKFEIVSIVLSV
jgi:hypothetical protein